jgi:GT2 family glycosyltransferase
MNLPKVYVSILNWFNYQATSACVDSLLKSDYPALEIIVVDNGSRNDSLAQLRQKFPQLRVLDAGANLGYAGGNKLVADLALAEGADLVWVLNNDTLVRPETLTELVKAYQACGDAVYSNTTLMSQNPDIVHYSGSYAPDELSHPESPYDKRKGRLLTEVWDELIDKEARIYGHSLLIPVSVIRQCGFMDTEYFMFCEEEDYFRHLKVAGIPTRYAKKAVMVHESSGSFKEKGEVHPGMKHTLIYYGKRNRYFFDMRWNGKTKADILRARGGLKALLKFFIKYRFSSSAEQEKSSEDYFWNLAAWHAWLGKRGKTLDPADFR